MWRHIRPSGLPCRHTVMPSTRLEQNRVVSQFQAKGFTQSRCLGCDWWWAWLDAKGEFIESWEDVKEVTL